MTSSAPMRAVLRQMDRLFREGTNAGEPDDRLLERFLAGDDEAFAALVARHGPMVLRTGLDRLRDPNDAEDAFQATFLALARRGSSIRGGDAVGAWLHSTARRVARRLNAEAARRRREERGIGVPRDDWPGASSRVRQSNGGRTKLGRGGSHAERSTACRSGSAARSSSA